jgi:hypothetical protein
MTAAYVLTGLRVGREGLAQIDRGVGVMQESSGYPLILEEGEIQASRRLLLCLGRNRFGPPDAATEAALTAITDPDRLGRLADAVLTASSWPELLATP